MVHKWIDSGMNSQIRCLSLLSRSEPQKTQRHFKQSLKTPLWPTRTSFEQQLKLPNNDLRCRWGGERRLWDAHWVMDNLQSAMTAATKTGEIFKIPFKNSGITNSITLIKLASFSGLTTDVNLTDFIVYYEPSCCTGNLTFQVTFGYVLRMIWRHSGELRCYCDLTPLTTPSCSPLHPRLSACPVPVCSWHRDRTKLPSETQTFGGTWQ